ncbi:MAG TPA: hypothetical protein VJL57_01760 [Candidatus Paceibacterota bacterium]
MTKNFMQDGKWIDQPRETKVALCTCGNKYIKTRDEQQTCLRCISEASDR